MFLVCSRIEDRDHATASSVLETGSIFDLLGQPDNVARLGAIDCTLAAFDEEMPCRRFLMLLPAAMPMTGSIILPR